MRSLFSLTRSSVVKSLDTRVQINDDDNYRQMAIVILVNEYLFDAISIL